MKTKRRIRWQRGGSWAALASIATAWMFIGLPGVWAQELFVPNRAGNSVDVYSRTDSGSLSPRRTLIGPDTRLDHPQAVVVDTVNNELVVLNAGVPNAPSITVYERTTSGNIAPIRTLAGAATGLSTPLGMAVDLVNNELFVSNYDNGSMTPSIAIFGRTASGNTAPIRTLVGAATGLNPATSLGFQGLVVDTVNNELLVANGNNTSVTVYSRTASGNTAPIRTLTGGGAALDSPCGLAVDTVNNELFVANPTVQSIGVFPRTANGAISATRVFFAGGGDAPCGLFLDVVNNELVVTSPRQSGPHLVSFYNPASDGAGVLIRQLQGVADPGNAPAAITTSPPPNAHTTIGLYRPSNNTFFLRNSNTYGFGEVIVSPGFAAPGDVPLAGDWNGDGVTTTGLFDPSDNLFLLATSNTSTYGVLFVSPRGAAGDLPIVGDWDGDGTATVGLFRPSTNTFYLWNSNVWGLPDITVTVGAPGDLPIVGDWDGNGTTTLGLYRPSTNTFYLWNSNIWSLPDITITVGAPGDLPIVGDWDGNGTTTIGLYRPGTNTFYLWNSNISGPPDLIIPFGAPNDLPVVGNWDGL